MLQRQNDELLSFPFLSCLGLEVCGSSQNEYCRIRMVETSCSRVIQTYLWRSLGIDIIFTFLTASVESFRFHNPVSCGSSVEQI